MKNYESPVVLENENLAEGVFAASGAGNTATGTGNCWYFNRAWRDNERTEEGYYIWHVEWIHNGTNAGYDHHSGGLDAKLYVSGPALVNVKNPGWDNEMTVSVADSGTINLHVFNECHYVNNGPESKTFNIGVQSNSLEETGMIEITGGDMIACFPCNQHPNG